MLKIKEICKKITKHTKWMIHFELFVFSAVLTAAAVCGIIAESTPYYYELIAAKNDLIFALRPCMTILGIGAIAVQWLETGVRSEKP